ncbi:MAG: 4Fe-4S dicluster domain-containing protein [Elusimicrobiales bacterium]|nr:4Fe-4S dicluster domain-containing protein [Elusimicrobiales bacterium]
MKVNPELIDEIKKYGAFDISACFNCGNCTAVCPLAKEDISFPRKLIRAGHIGLEEKLFSGAEPWHCYYCGECSATCPREAQPGEYMMALRRYQIAKYDITGLSKIFYQNGWLQTCLALGLLGAFYWLYSAYTGDFGALAGKIELAFPVYVTVALGGYLLNMYRHNIVKPLGGIKLSFKPAHIWETFLHGFTQKNFLGCEETDWWRWVSHLLVMTGYTLTLVISNLHLLEPLNKHYGFFSPASLLVWYAGLAIIVGGGSMSLRRMFKSAESSKFSHPSDWLFVVTMFLIGASMLATQYVNVTQGPESALLNGLYRFNIAVETVWILLIVPFTKWIHIFFRPLAVYFQHVKKEAEAGTAFSLSLGK